MKLSVLCLFIVAALAVVKNPNFIYYNELEGKPYKITWDKRSFFINDRRTIFLAGSVHYPRATPEMWDTVLDQAVEDGLNLIQIYTFWNYHEPEEGKFDWTGRGDLRLFLDKCKERGLFVNLRIGPYVCAEWDNGGIPSWLQYKEGIRYRSSNELWEKYMGNWMKVLVEEVRDYFSDVGGPIMMAQIENELWNGDKAYIDWCGKFAMELKADIPWVMCNGDTAGEAINACNGNNCDTYLESGGQSGRILVDQPGVWTENEGWFETWGMDNSNKEGYYGWDSRTPEDYSYAIMKWFDRGGSYHNYYMWFGGNHYGRSAAAGLATWYTNGVLIRSDTLPNEPKHSHLVKMHKFIASIADILLNDQAQVNKQTKVNEKIQMFTYQYNGKVLYFLENQNNESNSCDYMGHHLEFAQYQMYVIDQNGEIVYNTHDVEPAKVVRQITPVESLKYTYWNEPLTDLSSISVPIVLPKASEQINITRDLTEFLYYETTYDFTQEDNKLDIGGAKSNGFILFIDGKRMGSDGNYQASGEWYTYTIHFKTTIGKHTLLLLSQSYGLSNGVGSNSDPSWDSSRLKGICGWVKMNDVDFFTQEWKHYNGLAGESIQVYTEEGIQKVEWKEDLENAAPITWLSSTFETPKDLKRGIEVLFHPMGLMTGHAYINGNDIGKYLLVKSGSGEYTQEYYHIPKDWLRYDGEKNLFVVVETSGAENLTQSEICITQMVPK
ncbi:hypothetical protein WA158_000199 [Blastocystis sp. Blastoise]